ncbi:DNA mismatch repair protein MutS [Mesoflavibacter profundi]|uniref:DNA mismatch repair protein MutS n=2 Tax=Flavobacteriaceae TaxID=49546 RepID=A0ABT4RX98_9FLAO|nr:MULTISPECIES: Smr/MutS family protein [Mesoflavibacter]MDA0176444.1 DNA mismatch repair protein MutS [Mesoflavibacter profundi]
MMFKVGDKVEVLDDVLSGTVKSINNSRITIVTEEGFDLDFDSSELVVIKKTELNQHSFNNVDLRTYKLEKEDKKPKKSIKIKPKERYQPKMEVDLHLHKLVDNERGMSNFDKLNLQLDTARRQLDFAIRKKIQKIVFIHGVGEGVLKMELESLFSRYNNIKYYEADYKKYGFGATEVYIFQNS